MSEKQSDRRDVLIDTALRLFYRDGYHATGIDKILAEAGVAKMTLYKYFKTKDELILAALRRRDENFRTQVAHAIERRNQSPRASLLMLFDILETWFADPEFSGCMFINAAAEYARPDDSIHLAAAEHKRLFADYVCGLATAAGARDPATLTSQLMLLWEGAITTAHVCGPGQAAQQARAVAEMLVDQATK